ncbi:MAG: hypothetical protein VR64_23620 [Desulfatitalea sp. BRH_c12]|nr:MAG: hypothetical protein VR64_23620 [Desulfatitalea sp. BRH_c12]
MDGNRQCAALRTCVSPEGRFVYGLHRPCFSVTNLRTDDWIQPLGKTADGRENINAINFPSGDIHETGADPIYEIANPFPFRGTTFIGKPWADQTAGDLSRIRIPSRKPASLSQTVRTAFAGLNVSDAQIDHFLGILPRPLQLAAAVSSSDPADLVRLAGVACDFIRDPATGQPCGLVYTVDADGRSKPHIRDQQLFDAVGNNPCLPDAYKVVMVLRPGVQGESEIVGEWRVNGSHIFEYLRRNSYIPWGHYAANMAHDAVRYAAGDLTAEDILGLRHLYYQRTYVHLAEALGLDRPFGRRTLAAADLERLRRAIVAARRRPGCPPLALTATLWGWNYGFDFAPNGYRLHASHQQIHQQFALVPDTVAAAEENMGESLAAFSCGDMIQAFIQEYRQHTGQPFFDTYLQAIASNRRMDGRSDRPTDLVVYQDARVVLFVPKAQTSQWELQLMTRTAVGNILEADEAMRDAIDRAMLLAMQILSAMGAAMITVIEYSKRFTITDGDQRLIYAFLPRLPESPGAFSEAQLRWINGHYPEDFAQACRMRLPPGVETMQAG